MTSDAIASGESMSEWVMASDAPASPRVLVGGLGYHWQRDASFGLVVINALAQQTWSTNVDVMHLDYGAIFVAQDLGDTQPPYERAILLVATERGREPGRIYRGTWDGSLPDPEEIQARIREAGAGVIDLDHLLVIATHFRALPRDVVLIELEPVDTGGGEGLSPEVQALLPEVIELVQREVLAPAHPEQLREQVAP